MSVDISEFNLFFNSIYGKAPFPWQTRLANLVFNNGWPGCIDLPTASGKTSTIDIAVFVLACQAEMETKHHTVGRRVFFTVNRRVIVDEAHERALNLAKKLLDPSEDILQRVAAGLRSINAGKNAPPLDVAELRGGIYRGRRWARGITQPIVVATTADQLGSRLLFRGYGVSPSMQPIHAALTACDSLILLDEAHVTRAFSQTLHAISKYRGNEKASPPMRFVQMTATPTEGAKVERFRIDDADRAHPVLAARQNASKPVELVDLGKAKGDKYIALVADRAVGALSDDRKAIGVIVNRVQTARDVHAAIVERLKDIGADVHLVIGRMRPLDRDQLTDKLRSIIGPDRRDCLPKPCFVIATQCLEVGADYDFDALITECASIDALRQRYGRLNRRGRRSTSGEPFPSLGVIVTSDAAIKEDDPVYGPALRNTWNWLTGNDRKSIDFGIRAFEGTWESVEAEADKYLDSKKVTTLLAPAPDAAILLPAHLDALCQTAPQAEPSPEVSHFIHGPQPDDADVQVCWRADLGENMKDWPQIVSMLPPTSPECMSVSVRTLKKWMGVEFANDPDADISAPSDEGDASGPNEKELLVWRGSKDSFSTADPRAIFPGDTVVVPVSTGGWNELGYIPGTDIDIAEAATSKARRQRVIRVHVDLPHGDVAPELFAYATSEEKSLTSQQIRDLLRIDEKFKELPYPKAGGIRQGILFRFVDLLPEQNRLELPAIDEEDDDDSLSEIGQPISLAKHTKDVVDAADKVLEHLHLSRFENAIHRAAELHDLGKADVRFQALLLGCTPDEAAIRPVLLGKSGERDLSLNERRQERERSQLPDGFRHEMFSVQIVENAVNVLIDPSIDTDLLLHLIGSHHGHARPLAPISIDAETTDDWLEASVNGSLLSPETRRGLVPSHRLDSGVAKRFWGITRVHGWWGLAFLESVLRLADQQASASEQNRKELK